MSENVSNSGGIFEKPIKISEKFLQFYSAAQLRDFANRYTPPGERFDFQFAEPVKSGGGEVYIPAGMIVNEARIENLDKFDAHNPHYRIQTNDEVLSKVSMHLRRVLLGLVQRSRGDLMEILRSDMPGASLAGVIQNALYNKLNNEKRMFTLWLLRIYEQDRKLALHLARFGLYALVLAFVLQKRGSFTHRYSFQAGLMADVYAKQLGALEDPMFDRPQKFQLDYAYRAAEAAEQMQLEPAVIEGLRNHLNAPDAGDIQGSAAPNLSLLDDDEDDDEHDAEAARAASAGDAKTDEQHDRSYRAVKSILKIARFIMDAEKKKLDPVIQLKNLIAGLAYHGELGALPANFVNPVLARCRDYEPIIKRMRIVAQLEQACVRNDPDAAWAYPKPESSQVLCLKHREDCPNFVRGRPLSVVSHHAEAFLAKPLPTGDYGKCKLAEGLPERV